jgi:hypothetical protein
MTMTSWTAGKPVPGKGRPRPSHRAQQKGIPLPARRPMLPGSDTSGQRLSWRFCHVDHEGPWAFDGVGPETMRLIMGKLASFETMTRAEAFCGHPGKDYDVADIPTPEALLRLEMLGIGDMTRIARLQLTGQQRLYGFLVNAVFHIVWWDPEHQIWPSKKKNT